MVQTYLLNIGIVVAAFALTEASAWANHRFIMHGPLWRLHSDHHRKDHDGWFERNDLFFIIYAVPSFFMILFGALNGWAWYAFAGLGIFAYGIAYFLVHDVIIHQRIKWWTHNRNLYVLALRRAHKAHHKTPGKHGATNFGMLLIHPRYFAEARKLRAARK